MCKNAQETRACCHLPPQETRVRCHLLRGGGVRGMGNREQGEGVKGG